MNVSEQLLQGHSRANADLIVDWVGNSQSRFDELLSIMLSADKDLARRASWPLSYASVNNPGLLQNAYSNLFKLLDRADNHPAIRRNCMFIFRNIQVPEEYDGELIHRCFLYIENPDEAVAVQASALEILRKYMSKYPEIQEELIAVIKPQLSYQNASYQMKARQIIREAAKSKQKNDPFM